MQLSVSGRAVRVLRWGSGLPVLCLHGNPDNADSWSGLAQAMPDGYQLIAPDLPGFGRSEPNPAVYGDLSQTGQWLDSLLGELALDCEPCLVVHDLGAWFGFPAMVRAPKRFCRTVICGAPFGAGYSWHLYARIWRVPWLGEASMRLLNRNVFRWVLRQRSPNLHAVHVDNMYQRYKPPARRAALDFYRLLDAESLAAWQAPVNAALATRTVLTLWGDDDRFVPVATAGCFTRNGHVTIKGAGHWPHLDRPAVVARELVRFLRGSG